jgi:hypothetical protein
MPRAKTYILWALGLFIIVLAVFLLNPRSPIDEELKPTVPTVDVRAEKLAVSGRKGVVTDRALLHLKTRENPIARGQVSATEKGLDNLIKRLASGDDHESVDALLEAQELNSKSLLVFVKKALDLPGQGEYRKEAFDLLLGYNRSDALPLLRQGFDDQHKEIRLAALEALEYMGNNDENAFAEQGDSEEPGDDPEQEIVLDDLERTEVLRILEDAFNDIDPEIRQQALDSLIHLELSLQVEAFKLAQQSAYEDVRSDVMHMTGTSANWDTMEIAINALKDPDPDIQEAARQNLVFYVGKNFDNIAEAQEWWQSYKHLFDDDLFLENLENLYVLED